jgi:hypothetical protein
MERAARDIQARILRLPAGVGGQVRAAQLRLVLQQLDQIMVQAWGKGILPTTQAGRKAAAEAAERAAETISDVLYTALPNDVAETVRNGLRLTAQAGIDNDFARVPRQLSARVYHDAALSSGQVEQIIRSGLISGLSAKELAADVYKFVSPTTPGGASYAAMRLARTEINNAFHEQQIKGGQRPGVLAVIWNLSGSHPKPDECNTFAEQDTDNLGAGHYKPGNVPAKPHPNCLCYLTYQTMNNAEFEKALKGGQFDDELDRRTKANLDRLGIKELPKAPAAKPKATVKTTTPAKKAAVSKKAAPAPKKNPLAPSKSAEARIRREQTAAEARLREQKVKLASPPSVISTPKLDKLPRTTASMPGRTAQIQRDLRATNPKYGSDPAYGVNCVHVVNTWELRARGYDVSASRLPGHITQSGRSSQEALERWRLRDGSTHDRLISTRIPPEEVKRRAEALPEGGRAWVRVSWDPKYGGGGHIFNVEKINGRVRWIEAQTGRSINIDEYIFKALPGDSFGFVRVDDLIPTDGVVEFIE